MKKYCMQSVYDLPWFIYYFGTRFCFSEFFFPNLNLEIATQPYYQLSFEHKGQKKSHILCSLLLY